VRAPQYWSSSTVDQALVTVFYRSAGAVVPVTRYSTMNRRLEVVQVYKYLYWSIGTQYFVLVLPSTVHRSLQS
jgi:hypothetical protein